MPPSSGELWGHHLMPAQVNMDFLLPNGILVVQMCNRDATLESIKLELWLMAKRYPLYSCLLDPSSYIFISITQDAEREEFYDETRRLCDLRLFRPFLKLIEPKGNREEKILNYDIGLAIGKSINEFNEMRDLEVMTFRREILSVCREAVDERDSDAALLDSAASMRLTGSHSNGMKQTMYVYPPEVGPSSELPAHLNERLKSEMLNEVIICIWVVSTNGDKQKYTVKVPHLYLPDQVIGEAIRRRTRSMKLSTEQQRQCVREYQNTYLLKICGCDEFLLGNYPISQFKYIRHCMSRSYIPQLMLMSRDAVFKSLPPSIFITPSYSMRGISMLQDINRHSTHSLWHMDTHNLRIRINLATYVNIRESGKIYVKTGIYHGTEPLCPVQDSEQVEASNPRWDQWLDYEIMLPDLPQSARLCLSICSVSKRSKRKEHYALAWGNVNLFDFNSRLQSDRMNIHLWPVPRGLEDLLNPMGIPGSNQNKDSPCLQIEFDRYHSPISFPDRSQIESYGHYLANRDSMHKQGSTIIIPENPSTTAREIENLNEIVSRDPLAEISEQEKELMWRLREECLRIPNSLPKLMQATKWNCREDVAQVYILLRHWPVHEMQPGTAMQLLYCTYADTAVRDFAVHCLEEHLSDEDLSLYLLQLVQVLKYEPYLDNSLTRFLLRRSLLNQRIGHFFFWHLKSEMHQASIRLRYGLILEAYCRACGHYLQLLIRQVEALEKLTKLTDSLKLEREDDQMRFLLNQVQQPDFLDALQNFPSPLDKSNVLGDLLVEQCALKSSKKRPLSLVWRNPDPMSSMLTEHFKIIFKNGDDLRQDMLTLQVIKMMDEIWKAEGLDLMMIPYGCLAMGKEVGMIHVVPKSKTILRIQKKDVRAAMQVRSKELYRWIREKNKQGNNDTKNKYESAIDAFTKSCAGYCVASFILGIRDRHPDNIMVNEDGQVFHIDFGHFLDHRKKKFGINRERVPFVLTEDFIQVIAKGADNPTKSLEFGNFMELCGKAYLCLRGHAHVFVTLFTMMLSCGIPELQSLDDVGYIRKTLAVEKNEREALEYFQQQLNEAYGGAWTTKLDWFFHWVKHRS